MGCGSCDLNVASAVPRRRQSCEGVGWSRARDGCGPLCCRQGPLITGCPVGLTGDRRSVAFDGLVVVNVWFRVRCTS